jgi:hypothetical protein
MVFLRFLELVKSGNQSKAKLLIETLANVFEISKKELIIFMHLYFTLLPIRLTPRFFTH